VRVPDSDCVEFGLVDGEMIVVSCEIELGDRGFNLALGILMPFLDLIVEPELNTIAVWDPHKGEYAYYRSDVMLFGNKKSVYDACRISEMMMAITNFFLGVPSTIYIKHKVTKMGSRFRKFRI
jgi:hypothetical protein